MRNGTKVAAISRYDVDELTSSAPFNTGMMKKYDTVGIDCIAMVVNDILCVGAEPIALVDYLAVEEPNPEMAEEIAEGLVKGAIESRISIIGGETASLPGIIKDFDLAGTGIGFVDIDKIITGEDISAYFCNDSFDVFWI